MTAMVPSERSSRMIVLSWPMQDEDPRAHRIVATVGGDRTRGAILVAIATAHDAQRTPELMVDRLRDPRAVGDERRRPQDPHHEQENGDIVDAGLAAMRRSRGALWGHPGTVAGGASRLNRSSVTRARRDSVSGAGTSGPRSARERRRGRGRRR